MNILTENKKPFSEWTDDEWTTLREWLVGMLHVGPATVTFTKKDGTERVMNCTLQTELLPKVEIKEDKQPRKKTEDVVAVYDLEAKGWRSFALKSIKSIQFNV